MIFSPFPQYLKVILSEDQNQLLKPASLLTGAVCSWKQPTVFVQFVSKPIFTVVLTTHCVVHWTGFNNAARSFEIFEANLVYEKTFYAQHFKICLVILRNISSWRKLSTEFCVSAAIFFVMIAFRKTSQMEWKAIIRKRWNIFSRFLF